MSVFATLVENLTDLLHPLFAASAAAAAIVLFTMAVRLLVLPLSRASARGQKARQRLQPKIAELRRRHRRNPERFKRALLELHAKEKVSPLAGILPGLFQLPAFFLLYYLFSSPTVGGRTNELLGHRLGAAPLGDRWADALSAGGPFGAAGLVYAGLFVLVAGVATFSYTLTKRMTAAQQQGGAVALGAGDQPMPGLATMMKVMPFLSFFTLVTVAVVPLAAALYVVTSTTWTAVERAVLYR